LEGTHSSSKTFHVAEHVRARAPLEISSRLPGGRTPLAKNRCSRDWLPL